MIISKLKTEEVPHFNKVFAKVLKEGFPEYSRTVINFFIKKDFSPEVIQRKIFDKTYIILVAKEKGKIIGFLIIDKLYGGVSYCPFFGIIKEFRGQGIGRLLVAAWEKMVSSMKGHKLMMMTQSQINRNIFTKYGFMEEGFEKTSWFGLDAWLFGKIIGCPNPRVIVKQILD